MNEYLTLKSPLCLVCPYCFMYVCMYLCMYVCIYYVSTKRNLQMTDGRQFRKHVSCFYAQGGNVGALSLK